MSTPDLDSQLNTAAHKKVKSKRFSPSMKLRNLKGRSTPDIKLEDQHRLEALTNSSATASSTATDRTPDAGGGSTAGATEDAADAAANECTIQEFSIVEQCIKQFEEFYHIYLARNVLNIQDAEPSRADGCPVTVQLIGSDSMSLPSTPRSAHSPVDGFDTRNSDEIVRDPCAAHRRPAIGQLFDTLRIADVSRAQRLHSLLHQTLSRASGTDASDSASTPPDSGESSSNEQQPACDERTEKAVYRLMNLKLAESVRQAVRLASTLLVEMSTFPNYTQTLASGDPAELPAWLQVLTLVACYARCDRDLQLVTIGTLFDLITLIRSQLEHGSAQSTGVTFVVMIPLLQYGHVQYLEQRTRVLQVVTSTLWDHLGRPDSDPAHISALLYQLNSGVRSGLIETVLGHRMANTHAQWSDVGGAYVPRRTAAAASAAVVDRLADYRAERLGANKMMCAPPQRTQFDCDALLGDSESQRFRKFELLWEYGRTDANAAAAGFEKTLLTVFDQLALPYHLSIRTFVTKWLQESLLRGDMHRLVSPLMRIMFAAGTKRISVKHAHLIRREAVERFALLADADAAARALAGAAMGSVAGGSGGGGGDDEETDGEVSVDKDVYAICSADGNVKYHSNLDGGMVRGKKRSPMRTLQKKFFGVTLGGKHKAATAAASPLEMGASATTTTMTAGPNISLIVNPLDSSSDIDAWDASEAGSPVGSAPTKTEDADQPTSSSAAALAVDESMRTQIASLKEDEYYSSCEEETDESYSDTDSETRDEPTAGSLSSARTAHAVDIKRFAGDCERVTEMLSQHDRTKNRKQYQVSRPRGSLSNFEQRMTFGLPVDQVTKMGSRQSVDKTDGLCVGGDAGDISLDLCPEAVTPSEDYFSSMTPSAANGIVESFVSDLLDKAVDQCESAVATGDRPAAAAAELEQEDEVSFIRSTKSHRRTRNASESSGRHAASGSAAAKSIHRDASNRLSSASKTSSDSNRSRRSSERLHRMRGGASETAAAAAAKAMAANTSGSDADQPSSALADDQRHNFDSVDSGVVVVATGSSSVETPQSQSLASVATEPTRREPPTAAQQQHQQQHPPISWTVENSKKNADILRQTAASADSAHFLRRTQLSLSDRKRQFDRLHPFHTHMLLYYGVYDTKQVLYAFQTMRNIIACDCRTFLYFAMTTGVPALPLRQLLCRHRKSIFGKGFAGSMANTEFAQAYRGCMYLDVLFTTCLYYARSFFQREATEMNRLPGSDDIAGNCRIQLASVELLTLLCTELISIVKDMGKQLACYVFELLAKCKLQKITLHCILSCVHSFQPKLDLTFTENVLAFNEPGDERLHAESLQIQLLRLLRAVIRLEYEVSALKGDDVPVAGRSPNASASAGAAAAAANGASGAAANSASAATAGHGAANGSAAAASSSASAAAAAAATNDGSPTRLGPSTPTNVKYLPNCPISQQPMFLSAVLKALQCEQLRPLHGKWNDLITSSLNCFTFGSLTNIVISVIHQLCANVDQISRSAAASAASAAANTRASAPSVHIPPDYVCAQLQAITVLCHYCLLDSAQPHASLTHLLHQAAAAPQQASSLSASSTGHTGQLLHNIVHAILSPPQYSEQQQSRNAQLLAARNAVLSHLPVIVASVARLWDTPVGQQRTVRQQLIEFLSPVFRQHGTNFLAAVSVTWQERVDGAVRPPHSMLSTPLDTPEPLRKGSLGDSIRAEGSGTSTSTSRALPQACTAQLSLVKLVSSIRVMSMDAFVQTLHQVVKAPPNIHHPPIGLSIEVSALELFYFYMRQTAPIQLADCWPSLLLLLRDGIGLMPAAQFVILAVLNEFVLRSPQMPFTDRKDLRDLHDVTSRLVEALSNVAGARLEQTTWLRRNLAVKEDLPQLCVDGAGMGFKDLQHQVSQLTTAGGVAGNQVYSVQAQSVMAAVLANLLDVAYGYQDKDKVVTIITTLMYNITPYLKNHTVRNVPSFYACSQLLASLSGFQVSEKSGGVRITE